MSKLLKNNGAQGAENEPLEEKRTKKKKPPRVGSRKRINPWYSGMTRTEIIIDTAKTAGRWLIFTVLAYVYWLAMLLIMSIFLLNVWHVSITQILIYSGVLCAVSSVVYAYSLIKRKFYY